MQVGLYLAGLIYGGLIFGMITALHVLGTYILEGRICRMWGGEGEGGLTGFYCITN